MIVINVSTKDTDMCDECSVLTREGCSCHIAPPCGYCVGKLFEEIE